MNPGSSVSETSGRDSPTSASVDEALAIAEVETRRRRGISLVWIIPIVAAIVAGWIALTTYLNKGPVITISFETGDGLEAGKTKVKFKDVDIGTVDTVKISEDLQRVTLTARMNQGTSRFLTSDARFWIVRPRIGAGGVSGLGTLLSGAYIEVDPGKAQGKSERTFTGLEVPPLIHSNVPGRAYVLKAPSLGSISRGASIYYRGLDVGQILGYELAADDKSLIIHVFVRAPYDKLVRTDSRFWNVSGLRLTTGANGISVEMASVQSLLVGGVEFDTPTRLETGTVAAAETAFELFDSREAVAEEAYTEKVPYMVRFEGSLRGLKVGAPVEFRGLKIGSVTDIRLQYDPETNAVVAPVLIEIEPQRLQLQQPLGTQPAPYDVVSRLVDKGLRAQLVTGSLLTGDLLVSLDFHPKAPAAKLEMTKPYPAIPAVPTQLETLTASLNGILQQLSSMPLPELIADLRTTVNSLNATVSSPEIKQTVAKLNAVLTSVDAVTKGLQTNAGPLLQTLREAANNADEALRQMKVTMTSANEMLGPNSQIRYGTTNLLNELTTAARSIRVLTDYLDRHPEALLRGKTGSGAYGK
jgi:paraquat-inducible protein B